MDKHEFAEKIIEGLKRRKAERIQKNIEEDKIFIGYATDRSKKVQKEHSRLRKL